MGNSTLSSPANRRLVSSIATMETDLYSSPSSSSYDQRRTTKGHLSTAYAEQLTSALGETRNDHHSWPSEYEAMDELTLEAEPLGIPDLSGTVSSPSSESHQSIQFRCQTIAQFDYMCENCAGPHSWITDPLIFLVLAVYSTILFALIMVFIYNDKQSRVRSP